MNPDPCAGHTCDGCAICRSGVCCQTVQQPAGASQADGLDILREAIVEDAANRTSFAQLIRSDHLIRSITKLVAASAEHKGESHQNHSAFKTQPLALPTPAAEVVATPSLASAMPALPAPKESLLDVLPNQRKVEKQWTTYR